jgi:hypothetical protein
MFERTRARLEADGIPVCCDFGSAVAAADFSSFERKWAVSFPSSLRQFYQDVGDGLTFQWFLDCADPMQPFSSLVVPTLDVLQQELAYLRMLDECLAGYDFGRSQDPEVARQHYERQLSFFPFLRNNAELICIEPVASHERVVFHDHEWSFYESGDSGIRLADSLWEFWEGWSSVGFVEPKHLWWQRTVGTRGVVWSREHFGFCLRAGAGTW